MVEGDGLGLDSVSWRPLVVWLLSFSKKDFMLRFDHGKYFVVEIVNSSYLNSCGRSPVVQNVLCEIIL